MSGAVRSRQVDRSLDDIIQEQQQQRGSGGRARSDSRPQAQRSQPYARAQTVKQEYAYEAPPPYQRSNNSNRNSRPRSSQQSENTGFSSFEALPPRDDPRAQNRSRNGQQQQPNNSRDNRGASRAENDRPRESDRDSQRRAGQPSGGARDQRDNREQREFSDNGRQEGGAPRRGRAERGTSADLPGDENLPEGSFKVGAVTDPRGVSQRVVQMCEEGEPPVLLTIGHPSINQAVKGIAIARLDMEATGKSLIFQPAFRHPDGMRPFIAFYTAMMPVKLELAYDNEVTLNVAATSNAKIVAGAIAGKIRESRKVVISAVGIDAVANMVLAVANARIYLEENDIDIKVEPSFERQMKNGQEITVMRFDLVAVSI